jgi:hypothetical protein
MLLSELVSEYKPLYPEQHDWAATIEYLYAEEAEHMATLTQSLLEKGWREPIVLEPLDEDSEEDDFPFIGDGTHRVAIALMQGVFTVPVEYRSEQTSLYEKEPLELVIENPGDELTEEEEDKLINCFRSFRLNEDIWITSDVMFGSGNRREALLNFDDETYCPKIKTRARVMLKELFPLRKFKLTVAPAEPLEDEAD